MSKFCSKCGNEVDDNIAFCDKCGNSMDGSNSNNSDNSNSNNNGNSKSKIAAGLLGIFLGTLGVHNFYLGYTGKGVAQLLISVLSCGFLAIVSEIWGLIEGIIILTSNDYRDANGNPLV